MNRKDVYMEIEGTFGGAGYVHRLPHRTRQLNGATDAEIGDAVHFAKSSAGWSTYVNGMQLDYDEFKREVGQACEFVLRST